MGILISFEKICWNLTTYGGVRVCSRAFKPGWQVTLYPVLRACVWLRRTFLFICNVNSRPRSRFVAAIVRSKLGSGFRFVLVFFPPLVYSTASGTRLEKQAPLEDGSQMLLFLRTVLCELVGRRDLSLSLSSFPAPQPLSPSWRVPGWADSLIHGTITSYFPPVWKMSPSAVWTSLKVK